MLTSVLCLAASDAQVTQKCNSNSNRNRSPVIDPIPGVWCVGNVVLTCSVSVCVRVLPGSHFTGPF